MPPDDLLADAWDRLAQGAKSSHHAFHTASLATVDADGWPQCRTVVLRSAEAGLARLSVHTDRRSPKCGHLAAGPRATLLFYDGPGKLQIRLTCDITLHTDDAFADERWAATARHSRLSYATDARSSDPVPEPPAAPSGDPEPGRRHFAVMAFHVRTFEVLHLHHTGHRRARFTYDGASVATSTWLAP